MKKLILIALITSTMVVKTIAVELTTVIAAASVTTSLLSFQAGIDRISIANALTNPVTVTFFDAPSTNLTYVVGSYVTRTNYVGSVSQVFTNISGVLQTNTFVASTTGNTTIPQTTNSYRILASLVVPASSTTVYDPTSLVYCNFGLYATNGAAVTITTSYTNVR